MNYNPFSLKGKKILVTGASSGIGMSAAIECAKFGAQVVITGRNIERLEKTYKLLEGHKHFLFAANLLDENDLGNLVSQLSDLDGVIHSAGVSGFHLFNFLKIKDYELMMDINFKIPLLLTHYLLKNKKINKQASIIFISSTSGTFSSYIGGTLYSASKSALNGALKGLALEYAPKKIRFNAVVPGMIETPIMEGSSITDEQLEEDKLNYPLKRYGKPNEVAWACIYLLSDASSWTTGSQIVLDGGRTIKY